MIVLGTILAVVAFAAASFFISWAIVSFGLIPLADVIWGIDLPFWPTLIVFAVVVSLISGLTRRGD